MPQFDAGAVKTAKIILTNPKAKTTDYNGMLFMGAGMVLMSETSFSLSAGQSKEVSFTVTMPGVAGTYPVYIGAFSNNVLIPPYYRGSEDVAIVATKPVITGVTWENNIVQPGQHTLVKASIAVTSPVAFVDVLSLTLGKYGGGVFTPSSSGMLSRQQFMPYEIWLDYLNWVDARIAYAEKVGASSTAQIWRDRKPRIQQWYQRNGFVFVGVYNDPNPNLYFEYYLTLSGGNTSLVYGFPNWDPELPGTAPNWDLFPAGQYSLKAAFTVWTSAQPGLFDVLVRFEGQGVSFVSLNALQVL